jgi:carbon storage regulator CsrA
MLVLGRRKGEAIIVGDVKIAFLGFSYGQAKIGIEAPDDVLILREELVEAQCNDDGYLPNRED